jgi:hypothetical protein
MSSRAIVVALLAALCACDSGSTASNAGRLVDNTQWVPTDEGEEFFGPKPEDAVCELIPIDCEDEYPWPENDCVDFAADSSCITAYVPECFGAFTVLSVYTRMPNDRIALCNWLTLGQPSLRAIRAGDQVEVRSFHSKLTAPVPNGEARMVFVVGDEIAFDYTVAIPAADSEFPEAVWTADKDYPEGTTLLFHVDNHGSNEYMLIEANVL